MNSDIKIALIDGTYTLKEAREILMNLVVNKIRFYGRKNFSVEIRKGVKDEESIKKEKELEEIRKQILNQISTRETEIQSIDIKCTVDIKIN